MNDMEKVVYEAFKKEIDKLCIGNKHRALKLLNDLNNNTYDARRCSSGFMLDTDVMANPFIAFKYLTWLSQFYPNDETANFMLECGIYFANTKEGSEEEEELYKKPYTSDMRLAIDRLIKELKEEIGE